MLFTLHMMHIKWHNKKNINLFFFFSYFLTELITILPSLQYHNLGQNRSFRNMVRYLQVLIRNVDKFSLNHLVSILLSDYILNNNFNIN